MSVETSGFTSSGYESFPSLHVDNKLVAEFSSWPIENLEHRVNEYTAFLQRPDLMPRAREQAERVREHILFELAYRDGVYDA